MPRSSYGSSIVSVVKGYVRSPILAAIAAAAILLSIRNLQMSISSASNEQITNTILNPNNFVKSTPDTKHTQSIRKSHFRQKQTANRTDKTDPIDWPITGKSKPSADDESQGNDGEEKNEQMETNAMAELLLHKIEKQEDEEGDRLNKTRLLPFTGDKQLRADHLFSNNKGSFWLPRPPTDAQPNSKLVTGYQRDDDDDDGAGGGGAADGFLTKDRVSIMMWDDYNAGDFWALYLAPMISGRVADTRPISKGCDESHPTLAVVGSILDSCPTYSWGAGYKEPGYVAKNGTKEVFAVRGPLTHAQMVSNKAADASQPDPVAVYGDAGSLISWYYQPHDQRRVYDMCIFPHYWDAVQPSYTTMMRKLRDGWPNATTAEAAGTAGTAGRGQSARGNAGAASGADDDDGDYGDDGDDGDDVEHRVHVLNIRGPLFDIIDELVRCKFVLSSTLHGVIFSDSYGIPNAHMKLSDKVTGFRHKFDDYYLSVNRTHDMLTVSKKFVDDSSAEQVYSKLMSFQASQLASYEAWWTSGRASTSTTQPPGSSSSGSSSGSPVAGPPMDLFAYWSSCPMHAEAYGQSREEHVQFASSYNAAFSDLLSRRPRKYSDFHPLLLGNYGLKSFNQASTVA